MHASLSFIIVILIVGVPMWWKTTQVYRVPLPYSDIDQLTKIPISVHSTVYIYTKDSSRSQLLISELTDAFLINHKINAVFKAIQLTTSLPENIKTPSTLEKVILESTTVKAGDFVFIEWAALTDDVLVTSGRTAFISGTTSSKKIELVLRNWIFQEHKLKVVSSAVKTFAELKDSRATGEAIQPFTDVVLSVINPNADLQTIEWDVYSATKNYVEVFVREMGVLSTFNVKTQWKFQVAINQQPQQMQDNSTLGRHYVLGEEYLTHFVTTLEKSVGQGISTNPNIQLVVYVPPCQFSPLVIYERNGKRSNEKHINSFISPKWGGVIIANPPEEFCKAVLDANAEEPALVPINTHEVMTVALHLIRKLLEVDVDIPISSASMIELDHLAPRDWELDAYIRIGVVNLLNSVTITLSSLTNLLNDINYIVINDEVGHAIQEANKNIQVAKDLLRNNELLEASKYAKIAFKYSEMAFFDPSLLALLYFPDEQKYAIYIPLFLPIMIPVLLSLNSFVKSLRSSSKKAKSD